MMKRHTGFTLLEVLVALAVLAIAMGAVIKVSATNSSNAAYLKEKTIAHWVAMNKVNELRLTDDWPSIGTKKDTEIMAGEEWRWQMKISKTAVSTRVQILCCCGYTRVFYSTRFFQSWVVNQ
mgnify:CR=1 FL=1